MISPAVAKMIVNLSARFLIAVTGGYKDSREDSIEKLSNNRLKRKVRKEAVQKIKCCQCMILLLFQSNSCRQAASVLLYHSGVQSSLSADWLAVKIRSII